MGPIRQGRRHGGITHRLVMCLHSGTGATRRLGQEHVNRSTCGTHVWNSWGCYYRANNCNDCTEDRRSISYMFTPP